MKEKLKNILSKKIFYVTLALLIIGIVEIVYASNLINSKNVSYSNSSSKLNSNNVQGAIDELYNSCEKAKETCPSNKVCLDKTPKNYLRQYIVTTGDGLYQDSVEKGKYFYRGNNPSNYIKFNNELWRIINMNEDGTIKIRRNTKLTNMPFDKAKSRTSNYCSNTKDGCNIWSSSTSTLDENNNHITKIISYYSESTTHELPTIESSLNIYLNGEYYNNLNNDKSLIVNGTFYIGLLGERANYKLLDEINQEKIYKWQGKIGLTELTDYSRTNSNQEKCSSANITNKNNDTAKCNSTTWLNDSSYLQWTMTPYESNPVMVSAIYANGNFTTAGASYDGGAVYPVVNLNSKITLSGIGKSDDPFTIS